MRRPLPELSEGGDPCRPPAKGASAARNRGGPRLLAFGVPLLLALAACEEEPESPRPVEVLQAQTEGHAFLEEDRLGEAEAAFTRVGEMAPDEPAGHADLGLVHLRRGELPEAREHVERAVSLAPDDPDHWLLLATVLEHQGELAGAREHLDAVLEANPDHRRGLYGRALLEAESGEPDGWARALPHLERLAELAEGNAVVHVRTAEALLHTGDPDRAASHLEELQQQIPAFPPRAEEPFLVPHRSPNHPGHPPPP